MPQRRYRPKKLFKYNLKKHKTTGRFKGDIAPEIQDIKGEHTEQGIYGKTLNGRRRKGKIN